MKHAEDEILNKYIDNELTGAELSELNDHLKFCPECLNKLKALQVVDINLKRLETYQVKGDFTERLMKRIEQAVVKQAPKKFFFFRFIFAAFILLSLAAAFFIFYNVPSFSSDNSGILKVVNNNVSGGTALIERIFNPKTIPVIGSALAFIVVITIYFVFESYKNTRSRLNKL